MVEITKKTVAVTASIGVASGLGLSLLPVIDPEHLIGTLSAVAQSQIAQSGLFFTLAAWVHSGRVKNEITRNFTSLTDAINNVGTTLRKDLEAHGKRLDNLSGRVETLEKKT